jgi:hypothetical protein
MFWFDSVTVERWKLTSVVAAHARGENRRFPWLEGASGRNMCFSML